ncbi:MAG: hypothetical protein BYD32DRAFT_435738 [Podila humilis]|nr:MAG: hypothetical protein BYD32DRAFT_435738 [Podila humilis]
MREIRIKIEVDEKLEDQIMDEIQEYQQNASVCEYQSACRYSLDRPQEFFQVFGGLTLTMLKMVRQGASMEESIIPPLDTFEILWNVDPKIISNRITKDTIRPLIDKSISYLQALPVAKCDRQLFCAAIKNFFVVPDGSNSLGGLCRSTQLANAPHWTCQEHQYQWLSPGTMKTLIDFVQGCGGHIDIQRASLGIKLCSKHQAEQLFTLLKTSNQNMDISIKIKWNASRRDLDDLLRDIVNANVYFLELDGVTHNMHPQGNTESRTDCLTNYLSLRWGSQTVMFLNYPQPQEHSIYFKTLYDSVHRLQLKQQQQVDTKYLANELQNGLFYFEDAIMTNSGDDLLKAKSQQLQCLLAKAGYHTVPIISSYHRNWYGEFNITERTLQELRLHEFWADEPFVSLKALASLRTLRLDVDDLTIHHEEIDQMLQASLQLQDLFISLQENRTLESIEKTVEMWRGRSSSLQLTLVEYDSDNRGHVVSQIAINSHVSSHPRNSNPDLQGSNASCTKTEFLQWNSDHVWEPLANLTAAFLDVATKPHPSVLRSFTLDISNLTQQEGLPHIQHILQQSMLRHLHICFYLILFAKSFFLFDGTHSRL